MTTTVASIEELSAWMASAQQRGAVRFELWERVRAGQRRVHVWTIGETNDVGFIADDVQARVDKDRRVDRGQVAYAVLAFRKDDATPLTRVFVLPQGNGTALATPSALVTADDANPQGIIAMLMRHNETRERSGTAQFETIVTHYQRLLDSSDAEKRALREQIAKLENERAELAQVAQEFTGLKHQQEMEKLRELDKQKRVWAVWEKAEQFLPVAMAALARNANSGKVPPGTPAAAMLGEELLTAFFRSLSKAQWATLETQLTQEQRALFMELFVLYRERDERRDQAKAAREKAAGVDPGAPASSKAQAAQEQ
jgi:hypothetical protein